MGYFGNLYLVEIYREGAKTKVKTTIYSGHLNGQTSYFSWGEGDRPPSQLHGFAGNTIFTNTQLIKLDGYPVIEEYDSSQEFFLDASFSPKDPSKDPIVFHIVFDKYYVPKRDGEIFEQPSKPSISKKDEKLVITYPVIGKAEIRFPVIPIPNNKSLSNFDLETLVRPDPVKGSKKTVGINLYFFKFEWQFEG